MAGLSSTLAIYRRSQRRTDWVAERIGVAWRVCSRRSRHVACACPLRHDPLAFAPVFVQARTWQHAQMLVLGALLVPGQRTVCNILRIIGLRQERHFVTWHRVLNRAVWDNRLAARLLLKLLVEAFVP